MTSLNTVPKIPLLWISWHTPLPSLTSYWESSPPRAILEMWPVWLSSRLFFFILLKLNNHMWLVVVEQGSEALDYSSSAAFIAVFLIALSCPTLLQPMDCSPPGSSVHGISQARTPEWIDISFSRRYPWPRYQSMSPALQTDLLLLSHQGSSGLLHQSENNTRSLMSLLAFCF